MDEKMTQSPSTDVSTPILFGILAEYENTDDLLKAAERVRDAGFTKWDTHTPIPVHGLDEAMGIRRTVLPLIVFGAGLTGLFSALLLQWWMNTHNYPFLVSGKPFFSLPANIPIAFELTILFSAVTTVGGMLLFNGLPKLYHGVFNSARFKQRMSSDRFFLSIEAADSKFDPIQTRQLLQDTPAQYVEEIYEKTGNSILPQVKKWVIPGLLILLALMLIPPALVARSRNRPSETTRLQLIWDMDQQPRFNPQSPNPMFADGRAMRSHVMGTVPRGHSKTDDHRYRGLVGENWAETYPIPVTEDLVKRGQERFNIFCAQCHGLDGYGQGPVAVRADRLQEGTWVPPSSFHDETVIQRPIGHIFNTITNGIRTMPAYGDLISVDDRWAVVAYVRALQRSQRAPIDVVPEQHRNELR